MPVRPEEEPENKEPIIHEFVTLVKHVLEWFDLGRNSREEILWGFLSTSAAFDRDEYNTQAANNEFSIGRIFYEMFTCNLQESLECTKVRSPLIPAFIAMFVFIFLITFFAPIPSVVSFFLWTLGLTYGVVYISYAYSPLCFPRIPVALGEGLYDVVTDIFPERLNFPRSLSKRRRASTSTLTLPHSF